MSINAQVEKIIIDNLYRYPSVKQLAKIREVSGQIVTTVAERSLAAFSAHQSMNVGRCQQTKRPGQPHLLAAVEMCCLAVDLPSGVLSHYRMSKYSHSVVYMLRHGIAFPVQPSWGEIADVMLYLSHGSAVGACKAAVKYGPIVAKMFDYLESNMVPTHPRPDWAKEAA